MHDEGSILSGHAVDSHPSRDELDLHEKLALAGRILAGEGLSRVSFGHVSSRSQRSDEIIALRGRSARDTGLEFAAAGDIVEMTLDAETVSESTVSVPRECYIHLEILRARPDVNSVVHIHPRIVVALRSAGITLGAIYGAYDPDGVRIARGQIAYYPRPELIDTPDRGRHLAEALGSKATCVLDGHGIVTVGDSVELAVLNAIALCELAHVTYLAAALGAPHVYGDDVLDELVPAPGQAVAQGGHSGASMDPRISSWQHWVARDRRRSEQGEDSHGPTF